MKGTFRLIVHRWLESESPTTFGRCKGNAETNACIIVEIIVGIRLRLVEVRSNQVARTVSVLP